MNSKILVATHQRYDFPEDALYMPVQVGKAIASEDLGIAADNTGENLSGKNRTFCELTALYWAWKNDVFAENRYCGLVHYRRYFSGSLSFAGRHILSRDDIAVIMHNCDVIVPKKRCYCIENIYDHYAHAHYRKDLESVRETLAEMSSEYLNAFDTVMRRRSLYLYNMFIMRTEHFYDYCSWLFPLLFEVEKRIDISGYDQYQRRVFGFIGERLFNVWLLHHEVKTFEVATVNLEGENLFIKGLLMLKRKFFR